jgi:hypothetical protein
MLVFSTVAEDRSKLSCGSARLMKLQTLIDGGSEGRKHRKEAICRAWQDTLRKKKVWRWPYLAITRAPPLIHNTMPTNALRTQAVPEPHYGHRGLRPSLPRRDLLRMQCNIISCLTNLHGCMDAKHVNSSPWSLFCWIEHLSFILILSSGKLKSKLWGLVTVQTVKYNDLNASPMPRSLHCSQNNKGCMCSIDWHSPWCRSLCSLCHLLPISLVNSSPSPCLGNDATTKACAVVHTSLAQPAQLQNLPLFYLVAFPFLLF